VIINNSFNWVASLRPHIAPAKLGYAQGGSQNLRALLNLTIFVSPMKRVDFSEVTGVRALSFRNLSVGETAGPDLSGQCGGGKTPPWISC